MFQIWLPAVPPPAAKPAEKQVRRPRAAPAAHFHLPTCVMACVGPSQPGCPPHKSASQRMAGSASRQHAAQPRLRGAVALSSTHRVCEALPAAPEPTAPLRLQREHMLLSAAVKSRMRDYLKDDAPADGEEGQAAADGGGQPASGRSG